MGKREDFYNKLKNKIEETTTFPSKYMYKFIIPSDKDKLIAIENMFNHLGAVITTKKSKSAKYTSITILVVMQSVDDVINKYMEVESVEGVISL